MDEINKYFLEQIENDVAKDEMQQIEDLDDMVIWFQNFGDLRQRQLEELASEFHHDYKMVEKCKFAISMIDELKNIKPV